MLETLFCTTLASKQQNGRIANFKAKQIKKGKFAKRKPKSPDDMTDENNNDIVEDFEQHIQWNEGRRIVELGKLAV